MQCVYRFFMFYKSSLYKVRGNCIYSVSYDRRGKIILAPLKKRGAAVLSSPQNWLTSPVVYDRPAVTSLILVLCFHITTRHCYGNHVVPDPSLHKVADFRAFYQDGLGPLQSSAPLNLKIMCCSQLFHCYRKGELML